MKKSLLFIVPSAIAALGYGAIAYYVNSDHGRDAALLAGLTQAVASACITLVSTYLMAWMFSLPNNAKAKFFCSLVGSGTIILSTFVIIHWLMGTPDILETVLPSAIIGAPYFIAIPTMMYKQHLAKTH